MKLARLEIQQLPGIQPGFTLDNLASGINVITGPNGIGKSSLIRALGYLVVEPAGNDPRTLSLIAEFENGGHWSVKRTGTGYAWELDGRTVERPSLPDRDSLHCYWLTMENLMQVGDDDQQLVDQLRQALAGGYNLSALRAGDFELRPRSGIAESSRLSQATRELREVENGYRDLERQEAELPELEARIEESRNAGIRAERLQKALELQGLIVARGEMESTLALFPPNMELLRGNEIERLEQLEQNRERLERGQEGSLRAKQDAETRLQETELVEARPEAQALQLQRKILDGIEHKQDQLSDKQEALGKAQAEERIALKALGSIDRVPLLEPEQISRAERLATDLKNKKLECGEAEARLQNADEAPGEQAINRHAQAVQALAAWLAVGEPDEGNRLKLGPVLAGVGGLLAIVAGGIAHVWVALGGGAVAVVGALWSILRSSGRPDNRASEARRDFYKQQLDGPSDWNRDAVSQTLDGLQEELAAMRLMQQRAFSAMQEQERLERVRRDQQQLEQQRHELAEEIGFDPEITELAVGHFVLQVQSYQRAARDRQVLENDIARLEEEIDRALIGVQEFLSRWHVRVDAELAALDAGLSSLSTRAGSAEKEAQMIAQLTKDIERASDDLTSLEREINALYLDAGLDAGDKRALEASCAQLESWQGIQSQLHDNQVRETERRRALEDIPELVEHAENGDIEVLQRALDEAKALAAERDALISQHSAIKTRVSSAGGAHDLEKAMATVDQARADLRDRMDERFFAEAGNFLLNEVENEHRIEHEPEVLRDARERFGRFTHHAWDVELHEDKLVARDVKQGVPRDLEDLSSGTRMQLLLAVRLAWTRRLESNKEALPLFLDEALTTSDEQRFAAVAESLADLAREEGRQVFYLSARRQELGLWEKVIGERPHHIDLAHVRHMALGVTPEDYVIPEEEPLPMPQGKTPEDYAAEIGVPPVVPMQSVGNLHLFYLLRDDLPLLYSLMQDWNVTTQGQLESLLHSRTIEKAIPEAAKRQTLMGRCHATAAWMDAWRCGRGKPVDRIVLEKSGAITGKFIDDVSALAHQCGGNAERILQGLENGEVARFRSTSIEALRDYLEQEGFIDSQEPLDGIGRERQTLLNAGSYADPQEIRRVVSWLEGSS